MTDWQPTERQVEAAARAMFEAQSDNAHWHYLAGHQQTRWLRMAKAALIAAEQAAWEDIETAPKNGTRILLASGWPASWRDEAEFGYGRHPEPGWQIYESEDSWYSVAELPAQSKLYRPLPAPPQESET